MREAAFLTNPRFEDVTEGSETQKLKLIGPLRAYSKVLGMEIEAPDGFVFEESIPTALFSLSRPRGESKRAAALHDWIYRNQGLVNGKQLTRKQADDVYREFLLLKGVKPWRANIRWLGVRLGGGQHWKN